MQTAHMYNGSNGHVQHTTASPERNYCIANSEGNNDDSAAIRAHSEGVISHPELTDDLVGLASDDDAPEGEPSDSEPSDLGSEEDGDSDNDDTTTADSEILLDDLPLVQLPTASQVEVATSPDALKSCSDGWAGCCAPGQLGFNDFTTKALRSAGVDQKTNDVGGLLPHQMAVAFLLHPSSPIRRLLIDHPTGSGKTREMISVLDNFFHDPRPKIPIFPKESVCRNFYFELLKWPSKYRDFFSCLQPKAAKAAAGVNDWRDRRHQIWDVSHLKEAQVRRLCQSMRDTLEMKAAFIQGRMRKTVQDDFMQRFPGEAFLVAPLRALRYTSAGGGSIRMKSGMPVSTLFKIGFDAKSRNVYTNKVVVMDEVHNLVRSKTQYLRQLNRLRELLVSADNILLAGFTGTPILSEPDEGRKLLDIIKGCSAPLADEGYLASFQIRPLSLYPRCVPLGMPDAVLTKPLVSQLVHRVVIHGEVLKTYDIKVKSGCSGTKLGTYCNLYAHPSSFHGGKSGTRNKILGSPEELAPKLLAIAREIAKNPGKALVLISKSHGYRPMLALMKQVAKSHRPSFEVATMEQLSQFNDPSKNLRGEAYKVMVADAAQCAEGVSFLSVRRVFLAEVPSSPSALIQLCSRALRMYGHRWLPIEEQEVQFFLYVAQMPSWLQTPLAAWALRVQSKSSEGRTMEIRGRHFAESLQQAGIHSLQELKQFVVAYVQAKKSRNKSLDVEDVFGILVQLGLWNQVKRIWEAEYEELSRVNTDRLQTPSDGTCMSDGIVQARSRPGQGLVQALQELFRCKDLQAYQQTLCFETADANALRRLVRMTASFAPALANLRSKAVDGEVLRTCYDDTLDDKKGDDIVLTFDGDAFMVPSGVEHSVGQTFTLPVDWKVDQESHVENATLPKFFIIDPSGKKYQTSRDAQHAIFILNARQQALERGQAPGLRIIVETCEDRPDLNGHRGTLVEWIEAEGRWKVDVEGAGSMHISPEHVTPDLLPKQPANNTINGAEELADALADSSGTPGADEQLAHSEQDQNDGNTTDTETMPANILDTPEAVGAELSMRASSFSKVAEVVVLDEAEDVVDYFKDDKCSAEESQLSEMQSRKTDENEHVSQRISQIDLTHELSDYFRAPSKVERRSSPEEATKHAHSDIAKKHQLADFLRCTQVSNKIASAPKPATNHAHPDGAKAHQLSDFLRCAQVSNKTSTPDPPAVQPISMIDLTHELTDYFRLTGTSHQRVQGPPSKHQSSTNAEANKLADQVKSSRKSEKEDHRPDSTKGRAPCDRKCKPAASEPVVLRGSIEESKCQKPVLTEAFAASAAVAAPGQKVNALAVAKHDGHMDRNDQSKSALQCSTKRKLAFFLPGMAKSNGRDERDERDAPNDAKRHRKVFFGVAGVPAGVDTVGMTVDCAPDKASSDGILSQTAAKTAPLAEKKPSNASALLDIIDLVDLVDLDDGPVNSLKRPCQRQMQQQHSLNDWLRKSPVK